jgi:hypothetical protein
LNLNLSNLFSHKNTHINLIGGHTQNAVPR